MDFLVPNCSAENVVVYDTDRKRRLRAGLELAGRLVEQKWQVHVFSADNGAAYTEVSGGRVTDRATLTAADVDALVASASRTRTAVVIDGLCTSAGAPVRRLLKCKAIFVVSTSSSKEIRGDHRYSRVWTEEKDGICAKNPKTSQ